jgi:16S rRNA (cytosine967-C5)-methyltransferase
LYATCSLLHAENEAVVAEFMNGEPNAVAVDIATAWQPAEALPNGIALLPGRHETDGFYYALMARRSD